MSLQKICPIERGRFLASDDRTNATLRIPQQPAQIQLLVPVRARSFSRACFLA